MKRILISTLLAIAVVALALPAPAQEKGKDKKPAATEKKKSDTFPFNGKLTAVDKTAMTISLAGKEKARVFHITSSTKMTKAGKPAVLNDAVVGEEVGGLAKRTAEKDEVVSVRFGPRPEGAKTEKKEKKPKK